MDFIENDGVREEESFKFNVASGAENDLDHHAVDYSDPSVVKKQAKGRDAYNKDKSVRHKRLTN